MLVITSLEFKKYFDLSSLLLLNLICLIKKSVSIRNNDHIIKK
jgi:hypothetical protein